MIEPVPSFNHSLCGYDRGEVDGYLATTRRLLEEAWDYVRAAEAPAQRSDPADEGLEQTALLARSLRVRALADADAVLERARTEARELRQAALEAAREQHAEADAIAIAARVEVTVLVSEALACAEEQARAILLAAQEQAELVLERVEGFARSRMEELDHRRRHDETAAAELERRRAEMATDLGRLRATIDLGVSAPTRHQAG